jgi:hypothetical protein
VAALVEMHVQGVSIRKVRAISEELCGHGQRAQGHAGRRTGTLRPPAPGNRVALPDPGCPPYAGVCGRHPPRPRRLEPAPAQASDFPRPSLLLNLDLHNQPRSQVPRVGWSWNSAWGLPSSSGRSLWRESVADDAVPTCRGASCQALPARCRQHFDGAGSACGVQVQPILALAAGTSQARAPRAGFRP